MITVAVEVKVLLRFRFGLRIGWMGGGYVSFGSYIIVAVGRRRMIFIVIVITVGFPESLRDG